MSDGCVQVFLLVYLCFWIYKFPWGQKTALDPLKLRLQVVVTCPTWALGTRLGPFERTRSCLNHSAVCPASMLEFESLLL